MSHACLQNKKAVLMQGNRERTCSFRFKGHRQHSEQDQEKPSFYRDPNISAQNRIKRKMAIQRDVFWSEFQRR